LFLIADIPKFLRPKSKIVLNC